MEEILPTLNWIITTETDREPMLSFGTSSDRIFTDEGNQAYYITAAKSIGNLPIAPYVSLSYSEAENGFLVPFGVNFGLSKTTDGLYMFDGKKSHFLLTFKQPTTNVSLMLIDLKNPKPGISVGWGMK